MDLDLNKLTRNYEQNPLKRGEYPELQDIKYLFLELNLSREECAKICNCNPEKVKIVCQKNKLSKTKEQRNELRKRTNLEKYGYENVSQSQNIKDKKKQTCLQNYGVENPAQSKEIYNKIKETCLDRYGVESTNSLEEKKQKIKNTCFKKYNVENIMQVFNVQQKVKKTNKDKFGYDNVIKNPEIKHKKEETCLEKYGKENLFGSEYFKQKTKETNLEKYNVQNIMQVFNEDDLPKEALEIKQKIIDNIPNMVAKSIETKKNNNSFNTSSTEEKIYKLLSKKFSIERQYSNELYPFACDFYIMELDLYLEYNGTWTHGGFPYEDNDVCNKQLLKWKEKAINSDFYKNAIYTWTDLDVRKRKIAKQNNLNWLEFFNMKEFMKWYNNICEILN